MQLEYTAPSRVSSDSLDASVQASDQKVSGMEVEKWGVMCDDVTCSRRRVC